MAAITLVVAGTTVVVDGTATAQMAAATVSADPYAVVAVAPTVH